MIGSLFARSLRSAVVGRTTVGQTWVEAMPPATEDAAQRPARGGDSVSPIIITSNDLASAWASDRSGQPLYPLQPGTGRQREMAIRGGINIYPQEVEATLLGHANVADAAVVGWPSQEFDEEVAAFVVPRGKVDGGELVALCRQSLAPYKVPREVFVVDELPRNSLGKVVKTELVARLPKL